MKRKYKALIIAILIIAIAMSAFLPLFDNGHHCDHEGDLKCTICILISDIGEAVISISLVILLVKIVHLLTCLIKEKQDLSKNNTLIKQKVKLSD
ncbi:MAG: hypothetical protein IJW54_06905 [Clostridia bacterium]|nr:hypothetical protein [Clostridia bacterium]